MLWLFLFMIWLHVCTYLSAVTVLVMSFCLQECSTLVYSCYTHCHSLCFPAVLGNVLFTCNASFSDPIFSNICLWAVVVSCCLLSVSFACESCCCSSLISASLCCKASFLSVSNCSDNWVALVLYLSTVVFWQNKTHASLSEMTQLKHSTILVYKH